HSRLSRARRWLRTRPSGHRLGILVEVGGSRRLPFTNAIVAPSAGRLVDLAEIIENLALAATTGFGEGDHAVELLVFGRLAFFHRLEIELQLAEGLGPFEHV